VINQFLIRHPLVQLELILVNRRVDLVNEGIDVALRVRDIGDEDPSLIVRQLYPASAALVASPALLSGRRITHPHDLASLPVLGAIEADRKVHFQLQHSNGERCEVAIEPRLVVDDFPIRKNAAVQGLGITLLPLMNCHEELANGQLIRLLPDWSLPSGNLQAAYTQRRGMLPAVRAWIEHISLAFNNDPPWADVQKPTEQTNGH
jgi:DNA-binding transcriptional LysR family regulator